MLTANLAYYYRFNLRDQSGTTVYNGATNAYDGTLVAGATISSTTSPQFATGSLSLVAASSQYLTLPSFTMTSGIITSGITFSCWISMPSGQTNYARVFDLSQVAKTGSTTSFTATAGTAAYTIAVYYNANTLTFALYSNINNTQTTVGLYTTSYVPTASWTHLAWVMSSSSWTVYLNGTANTGSFTTQPSGSNFLPAAMATSYASGVFPLFTIGRSSYSTDPYTTGNFNDFRMYTTALTLAQVTALYTSAPLIAYSTNFGANWAISGASTTPSWLDVVVSSNGQYITGTTQWGAYSATTSVPGFALSGGLIGNVGIGVTNPANKLDVAGGGSFSSTVYAPTFAGSLYAVSADAYQVIGAQITNTSGGTTSNYQFSVSGSSGWAPKGTFGIYGPSGFSFFISPTGNVGIGVTNPGYPLDVYGTNPTLRIRTSTAAYSSGTATLLFDSITSNNPLAKIVGIDTGVSPGAYKGELAFYYQYNTSLTEGMRLSSNGYVGIGTNNPGYPLTLNTSVGAGNGFVHQNGTVSMATYLASASAQLGSVSNHPLQFFTNNGAAQITLLTSGNVGIGTTNPTSTLQVGPGLTTNLGGALSTQYNQTIVTAATVRNGTDWASGGTYGGTGPYTWTTNVATGNSYFTIITGLTVGATYQVSITASGTAGSSFTFVSPITLTSTLTTYTGLVTNLGSTGLYVFVNGPSGTVFTFSNITFQRLDTVTTGNVGIGTTNPTGALHMNGSAGVGAGYWGNSLLYLTNSIPGQGLNASNGTSIQMTNSYNSGFFNFMVYGYGSNINTQVGLYISNTQGIGVNLPGGGNSWGTYSDSRMKINITPLPSELPNLMKLNPITYLYEKDPDDNPDIPFRIGFLADEVESIYPNLVTSDSGPSYTNKSGEAFHPMTMSMTDLIPYLTKGIQELTGQLATQEQQLATVLARLAAAGIA